MGVTTGPQYGHLVWLVAGYVVAMGCGRQDGDLPGRGLGLDVLIKVSDLKFGQVGEVDLEDVS